MGRKSSFIKKIEISVALILFGIFIFSEIKSYSKYTFASISESGQIIDSRNFKYKVKIMEVEEGNIYVIENKGDSDNVKIKVSKNIKPEISNIIDGTKVKLIDKCSNKIVKSDFKIILE